MVSSTKILDGAEVDMNWKNLKHAQQHVQFFPHYKSMGISKAYVQLSRKWFNENP